MLQKKTWLLVTFYTTAGVMAMERACKAASLPGRIVPVPRSITADCGLAWRCEPTEQITNASAMLVRSETSRAST